MPSDALAKLLEAASKGPWVLGWYSAHYAGSPSCVEGEEVFFEAPGDGKWDNAPLHYSDFHPDYHALSSSVNGERVAGNYEYEEGGMIREADARLAALAPALAQELIEKRKAGRAVYEALEEHTNCDHWKPGDRRARDRWAELTETEVRDGP